MHGEAEVLQKMEATPESIRLGNMLTQVGLGTKLDAFVFYILQEDLAKSHLLPTFANYFI